MKSEEMADKRSECVSCNDKRIAPGDVDNGEAGNQYHRVRRRFSIGKPLDFKIERFSARWIESGSMRRLCQVWIRGV